MSKKFNITDPKFFTDVETLLKDGSDDIEIENFICRDWNVYYGLGNPENFEDPENSPEWYDSADVYDFYEKPFRDSTTLMLFSFDDVQNLSPLKDLTENQEKYEAEFLDFFVHYTFGSGGAYAAGEHFEYARRTIEILHEKSYTQKEFIKRNLCVDTVVLTNKPDLLRFGFHCSWDEEHGVELQIKKGKISISNE